MTTIEQSLREELASERAMRAQACRQMDAERAAREQSESRLAEKDQIYLDRLDEFVALSKENAALKVEYESRALWIAEMNRILGCENSDGFHSDPSPHNLATQFVTERANLRLALQCLYNETADYITLNHLGDVHHNRGMQLARDVLTT